MTSPAPTDVRPVGDGGPARTPEPIYIAQTAEREHLDDPQAWIRLRADESKNRGCQSGRATIDIERGLLLFEGWAERIVGDQGSPRWQLTEKQP